MQSSIIMNTKEINKTIVNNVLLMLKRRKDISKKTFDIYNNKDGNIETIFNIKEGENNFSIYIVNSILNSIISKSSLDEYLNNDINIRKIIIIKTPSKRTIKQLLNNYKNVEFFFLHEMLEDLPSKKFIPKHILLNEEESSLLNEKIKLNELSKIRIYDPMARYNNAKINDVFKIIRPNLTTIEEVFYRIVIEDKIDSMFL
jgi:DNA-directed RNA polymerase subunit H (RpoH/RPB5)